MLLLRWLLLTAALIAASTTAIAKERDQILGCWLKVEQQTAPKRNYQLEPRLEYCFRRDGRILGTYVEADGYAGDLEKRWVLVARSFLHIEGDRCAFRYMTNDVFLLADCLHAGEWKLNCRKPKYPSGCGNWKGG